jgi:hypothetical protein
MSPTPVRQRGGLVDDLVDQSEIEVKDVGPVTARGQPDVALVGIGSS